jgi:hypothetical protein
MATLDPIESRSPGWFDPLDQQRQRLAKELPGLIGRPGSAAEAHAIQQQHRRQMEQMFLAQMAGSTGFPTPQPPPWAGEHRDPMQWPALTPWHDPQPVVPVAERRLSSKESDICYLQHRRSC